MQLNETYTNNYNIYTYFAITITLIVWFYCTTCYCDNSEMEGFVEEKDLLFITVSSLRNFFIELNWNFTTKIPTRIGLFRKEKNNITFPPLSLIYINNSDGYYVTKIKFRYRNLPNGWSKWNNRNEKFRPLKGSTCLNYWIIAFSDEEVIKIACMKIEPTWMQDNRQIIGNMSIAKLMIPGTHNSGCFRRLPSIELMKSLDKFLYTQNKNIWTQLCFGIRYLDVSIGYYNRTDKYYVYHGHFETMQLKNVLQNLRLFSIKAEDEIIIFDIHRFPAGFRNKTRHKKLLKLIYNDISDIMIPRSYQEIVGGPTLNYIWQQKRRIIVSYGYRPSTLNSHYLWDPLQQQWGNKQNPYKIKAYLEKIRYNRKIKYNNPIWAAMAVLTPNAVTVMLSFFSHASLIKMADSINKNLTVWYRYEWCDMLNNVIATDFFLGNNMIDVCIYCNLKNAYNLTKSVIIN